MYCSVYFFLQVFESSTRALTKVGSAMDPARRLNEIQVGNPYGIEIAAVFRGTPKDEFRAHRALAPYRLRGEWFALQGAIDVIRDAARDGKPLPVAVAAAVAHLQVEQEHVMVALGTEMRGGR